MKVGLTHKDAYPEQYTHRFVGKLCQVVQNDVMIKEGIVSRVFTTRFGRLVAFHPEDHKTAYALIHVRLKSS